MYKIKTSDEQQHGPYMANVVEQWVASGKAGPDTLLQKVGGSEWKPLSDFPEFAALLAGSEEIGGAAPRSTSRRQPVAWRVEPRTSALAVASLIFGLLGVTALIGLFVGIVAQIKISRGDENLKGAGYAISGMVVSGIMLLFGVPILIGLLVPPWVRAQEEAQEAFCLERAALISEALHRYARGHDGDYPNPTSWCDELVKSPTISLSRNAFICPAEPQIKSGFALNSNLVQRAKASLHPRTVLFFESRSGWNGHGGSAQLANYRHRGKVTVGFADGSVEGISVWQVPQLRWLP
jgi:prepilin-type processing-associated H-X9-DG protein